MYNIEDVLKIYPFQFITRFGGPQNSNESFNSLIWQFCSKTLVSGKKFARIAEIKLYAFVKVKWDN